MNEVQKGLVLKYMGGHSLFRAKKLIGNEGTRNQDDMWTFLMTEVNKYGPQMTEDKIKNWWKSTRADAKEYNANKVIFKRLTGNPVEKTVLFNDTYEQVLDMGGSSHANGLALSEEMGMAPLTVDPLDVAKATDRFKPYCKPSATKGTLRSALKSLQKKRIALPDNLKVSVSQLAANVHPLNLRANKSSHPQMVLAPSSASSRALLCSLAKDSESGRFCLVAPNRPLPTARSHVNFSCASVKPSPAAEPQVTTSNSSRVLSNNSMQKSSAQNSLSCASGAAGKKVLSFAPGSPLFDALKNSSGKFCLIPISSPATKENSQTLRPPQAPMSRTTIKRVNMAGSSLASLRDPCMPSTSQNLSMVGRINVQAKEVPASSSSIVNRSAVEATSLVEPSYESQRETVYATDLYAGSMAKSAAYTNYHKKYNKRNNMVQQTIHSFQQNTAAVLKVGEKLGQLISVNQERNGILKKYYESKLKIKADECIEID